VAKIDLRKELKALYLTYSKSVTEVQVPRFVYLMIDGKGDPDISADYAAAVEALFSVSYTTRFMLRKQPEGQDYAVMPLEGLWWADDMTAFHTGDRASWQWTLMIMQPAFVSRSLLQAAMAEVTKKKQLPAIAQLRIQSLEEGRCAQILHVGPFSTEGPTVERLHAYIDARSARRGRHHEIYLTDIRRAAPSRWKTVIRQPME
jgi:hypothetical protein